MIESDYLIIVSVAFGAESLEEANLIKDKLLEDKDCFVKLVKVR